jgi:hypothetical protein
VEGLRASSFVREKRNEKKNVREQESKLLEN